MADKLLISVAAQQVSAARWRGKGFAACEAFVKDEAGLAAFQEYLATARNAPVYLMIDAVEEDYRFDSLPHALGSDRREMVARRLKQYYRNTPYCGARLLDRDPGKRRDDRYMFAALTNPELIEPWVQAVAARGLPIAGIYLLPMVSEALLGKLQIKLANLLVVSSHSSGLRLTYFRDQKLRISRLARTDDVSPQAIRSYAEEISNTRLYLHALHIMTLDEHLTVLIVDRGGSLKELPQVIAHDNPNIDCRWLSHDGIVSGVGIAADALDSSADALYLHLLGLGAPDGNLAPPDVTAGFRRHQVRRSIYALTGVTACAAAAWCALSLFQLMNVNADAETARRETAQLQAQYQEVTRQFPAAPTSAENLKRAVDISQKIGAITRSPEAMLTLVSQALERHPAIVLKTLGWRYARADIESDSTRAGKLSDDVPATGATGGAERHQSGLIEGEVRPFHGDYRAALEAINRFAETLSQQQNVAEVRILKLPLNISPTLTLTGNTADTRDQAGRAEFKLIVVLKRTT